MVDFTLFQQVMRQSTFEGASYRTEPHVQTLLATGKNIKKKHYNNYNIIIIASEASH